MFLRNSLKSTLLLSTALVSIFVDQVISSELTEEKTQASIPSLPLQVDHSVALDPAQIEVKQKEFVEHLDSYFGSFEKQLPLCQRVIESLKEYYAHLEDGETKTAIQTLLSEALATIDQWISEGHRNKKTKELWSFMRKLEADLREIDPEPSSFGDLKLSCLRKAGDPTELYKDALYEAFRPDLRSKDHDYENFFDAVTLLLPQAHLNSTSLDAISQFVKHPFNPHILWYQPKDLQNYVRNLENLLSQSDPENRWTLLKDLNTITAPLKDCNSDTNLKESRGMPHVLGYFGKLCQSLPPTQINLESLKIAFNLSEMLFGNDYWDRLPYGRIKKLEELVEKGCLPENRLMLMIHLHDLYRYLDIKQDDDPDSEMEGILNGFLGLYEQDRIDKISAMMPLLLQSKKLDIASHIFLQLAKDLQLDAFKTYVNLTLGLAQNPDLTTESGWHLVQNMKHAAAIDPQAGEIGQVIKLSQPLFEYTQRMGSFEKRVKRARIILKDFMGKYMSPHYIVDQMDKPAFEKTMLNALEDLDKLTSENEKFIGTDSVKSFLEELTPTLAKSYDGFTHFDNPVRIYKARINVNKTGIIPTVLTISANDHQDVIKHALPFKKHKALSDILKALADIPASERENVLSYCLAYKKLSILPDFIRLFGRLNTTEREELSKYLESQFKKIGFERKGDEGAWVKEKGENNDKIKYMLEDLAKLSGEKLMIGLNRFREMESSGKGHPNEILSIRQFAKISSGEWEDCKGDVLHFYDEFVSILKENATIPVILALLKEVPMTLRQSSVDRLIALINHYKVPADLEDPFMEYLLGNLKDLPTLSVEEWKEVIDLSFQLTSKLPHCSTREILGVLKKVPHEFRGKVADALLTMNELPKAEALPESFKKRNTSRGQEFVSAGNRMPMPDFIQFVKGLENDEYADLDRLLPLYKTLTEGATVLAHENDSLGDSYKDTIKDIEGKTNLSRLAVLSFAEPYLKDISHLYSRLFFLEGLRVFKKDDLPMVMQKLYPLLKKMRKNHSAFTVAMSELPFEHWEEAIQAARLALDLSDGNSYGVMVRELATFPRQERASLVSLLEEHFGSYERRLLKCKEILTNAPLTFSKEDISWRIKTEEEVKESVQKVMDKAWEDFNALPQDSEAASLNDLSQFLRKLTGEFLHDLHGVKLDYDNMPNDVYKRQFGSFDEYTDTRVGLLISLHRVAHEDRQNVLTACSPIFKEINYAHHWVVWSMASIPSEKREAAAELAQEIIYESSQRELKNDGFWYGDVLKVIDTLQEFGSFDFQLLKRYIAFLEKMDYEEATKWVSGGFEKITPPKATAKANVRLSIMFFLNHLPQDQFEKTLSALESLQEKDPIKYKGFYNNNLEFINYMKSVGAMDTEKLVEYWNPIFQEDSNNFRVKDLARNIVNSYKVYGLQESDDIVQKSKRMVDVK